MPKTSTIRPAVMTGHLLVRLRRTCFGRLQDCEESRCEDGERIRVNVSGQYFEFRREVLARHPDTLLGNEDKRRQFYDAKRREYFFDRHRPSFEAAAAELRGHSWSSFEAATAELRGHVGRASRPPRPSFEATSAELRGHLCSDEGSCQLSNVWKKLLLTDVRKRKSVPMETSDRRSERCH